MAISQFDKIDYAQFNPLSTQEMWAPLQYLREQHDKTEEALSQQSQVNAASLQGLNASIDKAAIDIHNAYTDQINKATQDLMSKGFLDSGRRRNLNNLKAEYNSKIVPLQTALQQRQAMAEEQRKMMLQDPTQRFTKGVGDIALADIVADPTKLSYQSVSGRDLSKEVAQKAQMLEKTIEQQAPELKSSGIFGKYLTAVKSGASLSEVESAMRQQYGSGLTNKMTNVLHNLVNQTMNEYGVYDKFAGNQKAIGDLWNSAASGLYAAIGSKQFGYQDDPMAIWRAQQKELKAQSPEPPGKVHMEYEGAYDEKDFKEINRLNKESKMGKVTSGSTFTGAPYGNFTGGQSSLDKNKYTENPSFSKLYMMAKSAGMNNIPTKIANKDIGQWADKISEFLKEKHRTANKNRYFYNVSDETTSKLSSALSDIDDIKDVSGNSVKKSNIFKNGKLVSDPVLTYGSHGAALKITDSDGKSHVVPFDMHKLGNPELAGYDREIQSINNDISVLDDNKFNKKYDGISKAKAKEYINNQMNLISQILSGEAYSKTKSADVYPGY